jgi:hypothetical protein
MQNKRTNAQARGAKVSRNNWEGYNIPRKIGVYADKLGLECLATGGNCDFIVKSIRDDNEMTAVLISEFSECPDTLEEIGWVTIQLDSEWIKSVDIKFDSVKTAMQFMSKIKDAGSINIGELTAR